MSCIGESDRNVENLFADAFDIRYIVSLQSTVFNAIYTSEDHVPGIRYIVSLQRTVLMQFTPQRIMYLVSGTLSPVQLAKHLIGQ